MLVMDAPTIGRSLYWLTISTEAFHAQSLDCISRLRGAAGFLAWGTANPTQAALMISGSQTNMSMVEQVKAKKAKAAPPVCNNFLLYEVLHRQGQRDLHPRSDVSFRSLISSGAVHFLRRRTFFEGEDLRRVLPALGVCKDSARQTVRAAFTAGRLKGRCSDRMSASFASTWRD